MSDILIFGTHDPLSEKTMQPYAYAYNNPIKFADPTGMEGEAAASDTSETGGGGTEGGGCCPEGITGIKIVNEQKEAQIQEVVIKGKARAKEGSNATSHSFSSTSMTSAAKGFQQEMIRNQPWRADGPIKTVGGPGDPFGIFEMIGLALGSSNSYAKYAVIPFLLVKGDKDEALKILAAERGLWSSTKNLSAAENAFLHFKKHGKEFPEFGNALQYSQGAHNFLKNSPSGTLIKTRTNGDILKFHQKSNTFGVSNAAGAPKTMFRPEDGIDYWLKQ